jgi:hypothetical protein
VSQRARFRAGRRPDHRRAAQPLYVLC